MATTTTPTSETGVLVQSSAWGYVPLSPDHAGVMRAWERLKDPRGIRWDVLAEIARMAERAADDLVIVGGPAVNAMLEAIQQALVTKLTTR